MGGILVYGVRSVKTTGFIESRERSCDDAVAGGPLLFVTESPGPWEGSR